MIDKTNWNTGNLMWVAGVLEGEAWFGCCNNKLQISCQMTDEDVVNDVKKIAGFGIVRGPITRPKTDKGSIRKLSWRWQSCATKDIYEFELEILPYMKQRRTEQILNSHELRREYEQSLITSRGNPVRVFTASSGELLHATRLSGF